VKGVNQRSITLTQRLRRCGNEDKCVGVSREENDRCGGGWFMNMDSRWMLNGMAGPASPSMAVTVTHGGWAWVCGSEERRLNDERLIWLSMVSKAPLTVATVATMASSEDEGQGHFLFYLFVL